MIFKTERRGEMNKHFIYRSSFFLAGMIVLSLGIAMTIKGQALGIGPWDVLHVGLYRKFGLTIGTWNIITGLLIILFVGIYSHELPKMGTWLNLVTIGLFIDFFNWLLPEVTSSVGHVIVLAIGTIVIGFGAGLYMSPNLGAGPRDSLMLILVDKFKFKIKNVRTVIEVIVAVIGWMLGGPVGIGTVLIALLIGQIIHITFPLNQKLLLKLLGEKDIAVLYKQSDVLDSSSL